MNHDVNQLIIIIIILLLITRKLAYVYDQMRVPLAVIKETEYDVKKYCLQIEEDVHPPRFA